MQSSPFLFNGRRWWTSRVDKYYDNGTHVTYENVTTKYREVMANNTNITSDATAPATTTFLNYTNLNYTLNYTVNVTMWPTTTLSPTPSPTEEEGLTKLVKLGGLKGPSSLYWDKDLERWVFTDAAYTTLTYMGKDQMIFLTGNDTAEIVANNTDITLRRPPPISYWLRSEDKTYESYDIHIECYKVSETNGTFGLWDEAGHLSRALVR